MGCKSVVEKVTFGSLLSQPLRNGLTKPKAIRGHGIKMVSMGELFANDRICDVDMDRVPVTEKEFNAASLLKGDLLFARQSLVREGAGKCSIVVSLPEPAVFESHLIRARVDRTKALPEFIYYYFKSQQGREQIAGIVEQVAAAGIRGSDLTKLTVMLPSLDRQNAIVGILSDFDNKILFNNRINDYLAA